MVPLRAIPCLCSNPMRDERTSAYPGAAAGVFRTSSHMGQVMVNRPVVGGAALRFETLVPMNVLGLEDWASTAMVFFTQ